MGNALSLDLRERAVKVYLADGGTLSEVAARFEISETTLWRWVKRLKETGSLAAKPDSGGKTNRKLFEEHDAAIMKWLQDKPDLTQWELVALLKEEFDITISQSRITPALRRIGFTQKKDL